MANSWYYAVLPHESACRTLVQAFDATYYAALMPGNMTLWLGRRSGDGLEIYFSPATSVFAADLLRERNAHRCSEPASTSLTPLAGDLNTSLQLFDNSLARRYHVPRMAQELAALSFFMSCILPLKLAVGLFESAAKIQARPRDTQNGRVS